jgi:hypothetical protein
MERAKARQTPAITSAANMQRQIDAAAFVPFDVLDDSGIIGSGYADIDCVRVPFVVDTAGNRSSLRFSLEMMESMLRVYATEHEAVNALCDRLFESQNVRDYQILAHENSRVTTAIGVRERDELVVAIFNGEELGYLAHVPGYGTHEQRILTDWRYEGAVPPHYLTYILEQLANHSFHVTTDLKIALIEGRFNTSGIENHLPQIEDLELDLSGFERQLGPDARNS